MWCSDVCTALFPFTCMYAGLTKGSAALEPRLIILPYLKHIMLLDRDCNRLMNVWCKFFSGASEIIVDSRLLTPLTWQAGH